jgi:hypothetical protein
MEKVHGGTEKEPVDKDMPNSNAPASSPNSGQGNSNGNGSNNESGSSNGNSGSGKGNPGNGSGNSANNNPGGNPGNDPKKDVTIFVNATPQVVAKDEMSFREIVALAALPSGPNVSYTLTFRKGHRDKPEGSLVEGGTVKIKDGMIFNVSATDKS